MNYLYLLLDLGSLSIPFLFSFHPKLKFYKRWKALSIALILTMLVFIPWDIIFTQHGIWGFNEQYFLKTRIFRLPLEEWLVFICITNACVFTHYALLYYFPNLKLNLSTTKGISYILIFVLLIVALFNYNKWYTFVNFSLAILVLLITLRYHKTLLQSFYLTFLVMLIPFFIVNGILTGSFIENEVVWYNNSENLNIRMLTIPIEDSIYAFSLILMNLGFTEYFYKKLISK